MRLQFFTEKSLIYKIAHHIHTATIARSLTPQTFDSEVFFYIRAFNFRL